LNKSADTLQNSDVFTACVLEMNKQCPALLQVLVSALSKHESNEKKVATVATIYGMVLHSRNNRASAIQRIYSSLFIRYHADNKVYMYLVIFRIKFKIQWHTIEMYFLFLWVFLDLKSNIKNIDTLSALARLANVDSGLHYHF